LKAKIVVAAHKSVGAADPPENLAASQRYLIKLRSRPLQATWPC
jgi:hypothetical protein